MKCRHVCTEENPADVGSRGGTVTENDYYYYYHYYYYHYYCESLDSKICEERKIIEEKPTHGTFVYD